MTIGACGREKELMSLLRSGHWPESCEPELRAHVDGCGICRDTVAVRTAMQGTAAESRAAARLDSPGLLWWRAQLRRRNAAVERVARPIAGAHRFALTVNLAVAVGLVVWLARRVDLWQTWFAAIWPSSVLHLGSAGWLAAILKSGNLMLLIPCVGIIALLGGVVVYLATERT